MNPLTPKDQAILTFLREYIRSNDESPTLEEIKSQFGYKSLTSVQRSIVSLEDAGYIIRTPQKRGIQLVETSETTFNVPIVGAAACGRPILAVENIQGYVPTDTSLLHGDKTNYFYLKAQGDSMNLAGIDDGDLVLIKSQPHADNGEKVVALIDDSATIKVLQRGEDYVALVPKSMNPNHKLIILREDFSIQGKVVKVIKLTIEEHHGL
ncbi:MAG TPA: transcriptional repressor LexA [Patescibacteria group bacterium]